MITRSRVTVVIAAVLMVVLVATLWFVVVPKVRLYELSAQFTSTTGLYVGDDVRVVGVKVGTVASIEPRGETTRVTLSVERSVEVPADAKAVIVATSLVSSRYIQLTPSYVDGPTLASGFEFPVDRTAVPVEWDEIKTELGKLTEALGPNGADSEGALNQLVDSAGTALDGNGQKFRDTLAGLSQTMKTLSTASPDIFATVRNLQAFATALSASTEQIEQFQTRLASVSGTLADSSADLGVALDDLGTALVDVQRFVAANKDGLSQQVAMLADTTTVLVDKRAELERVLHTAPTSIANYYNIYSPLQGSFSGVPALQSFGNPLNFICGAIQGLANETSEQGSKLCEQYLGPIAANISLNYPPIATAPALGVRATPDQLVYSDPSLAPGGANADAGKFDAPAPLTAGITVPQNLTDLLSPVGVR